MFPKRHVIKPCALALAGLLVGIGTLLMFFVPWIFEFVSDIAFSLSMKPTFDLWQKNPMPLYLEFYVFNWTNPEDIYNPDVKPKFNEIGPFVFEETKEKVNITWNSNNTITFKQLRYWYFNEEKSAASLSTRVTTINTVAATAAYMIKDWSYIMKKGFDISIKAKYVEISKTATVGEILFEGYDDTIINMAKIMPEIEGLKTPNFDKFGWFYTRNGSTNFDGTFNMVYSGENVGTAKQWNYEENLSYYAEGECNKVCGSAGEFFSPKRKRDQIGFFSPDICRYIPMEYSQDVNVDGTNGYKYILGDSFLDNGTKVPENRCYCGDYCSPYGALNVSVCKFGAPGFVSQPHFYGADPYYLDKIEGLNPIKEKHQMFMVLEPTTGLPLQVEARLQLSILVTQIDAISIFQKVPTFHFPVLWFEQKVIIPSSLHTLLKTFLLIPLMLTILAAIILTFSIPWLTFLLYRPVVEKICWKSTKPRKRNYPPEISTPEITDCELPLMKSKDESLENKR